MKCVSVVIPSYNRAHLLPYTIPSYVQELVGEIIIVDDCSTDNTGETIKKLQKDFPLIRYFRMPRNSKQTAAKNEGIKHVKYPYVYLGDDDSFITPNTIQELYDTLVTYDADVVGAKALYMHDQREINHIDEFIQQNSRQVKSVQDALSIEKLFYINFDFDCNPPQRVPFCHACALVKKEIFDTIHFDVNYRGNAFREETDLFTRVSAAGYSIYYDSSAVQINLPRNMILRKNSLLQHKLKASFYEFWNTYKYLRKNEKFLQKFYHTSEGYRKLWLRYMKDAIQVKSGKFFKILGSQGE
ncbi:glycosyltransferase family 2 protein [Megasphaera elsdenii]|uniref:glycosyltransferase family 2 protein n=1 Tax=Megasphaera elsdenii TaxID=907 RepID=UPI00242D45A6|nr:glycosyltransferase family 2 protein [Megasphaera elsdenii]